MVSQHLRKRLDPIPPERRLTHHHICRRTVADPTGICRTDDATLLEDGGEAGERLERCLGTGVLVGREGDGVAAALFGREGDRGDLGGEGAGIESWREEKSVN